MRGTDVVVSVSGGWGGVITMPETIAEATVPAAELIRLADRRDALTADGE